MAPTSVDDPSWIEVPPKQPDETRFVDMRWNIAMVSNVDTVKGAADVTLDIVMYWTDSRLVGWGGDLPLKLWTPRVTWENPLQVHHSSFDSPALSNAKTGRLKMMQHIGGVVSNPMQLKAFPFDIDSILLSFETGFIFRAADDSTVGAVTTGGLYTMRKIREPGEGKWIDPYFHGHVAEWTLHGVSTAVEHCTDDKGLHFTDLHIGVHISRGALYYFWKALMPLYLLTILSFTTFEFDVDDLPSRNETVSTYFLAAFAMLYVVGESLPRTDFLTKIDVVIVLTTSWLVIIGIVSIVLNRVAKKDEASLVLAEKWNTIMEVGLLVLYTIINIFIFVPSWWSQREQKRLLDQKEPEALPLKAGGELDFGFVEANASGTNSGGGEYVDEKCNPATIERPNVRKGAEYFLWSEL